MNLFEPIQRIALRRPSHPAIVSLDLVMTYANLASLTGRLAGALHERGVRAGDVVAVYTQGLVPHVPLTLAIARIGAVSLPLAATGQLWRPGTASRINVKFLVHGGEGASAFGFDGLQGDFSLEELSRSRADAPPVLDLPGDALWRIALSSGTTGRPKPIPCTVESQLIKGALFRALVASAPDERMLIGMGPAVMFAANFWLRALFAGRTLVGSEISPAGILDTIHRHHVTHLVTSPGNAIALMGAAKRSGAAMLKPAASMRAVVLGGSPVSPAQIEQLKQHVAPNVFVVYGATEVGVVAMSDAVTQEIDPSSAGAIPPWVEVQALADDGSVLPVGTPGRLRVRAPGMSRGYMLPQGEPATGAFKDGWFHPSDIGCVTPEGTIRLSGRDDDVINLSGTKVDPARVEAVLAQDDAVVDCAVFALLAPDGRPQLAAAVVLSRPMEGAALRDRCLREIGAPGTPQIVFVVSSLPRNEAGKLVRNQLADCVADAQRI